MMNRIFRTLICLVLSLLLVCGTASALAEPVRVAVVQPMTHTSLDQIRDTIIAALENSDIEFEIVTKNAERDTAALSTILENVKMDGVDILVPIATNTAQSAKVIFEDGQIPVVFAAVSDLVAAVSLDLFHLAPQAHRRDQHEYRCEDHDPVCSFCSQHGITPYNRRCS